MGIENGSHGREIENNEINTPSNDVGKEKQENHKRNGEELEGNSTIDNEGERKQIEGREPSKDNGNEKQAALDSDNEINNDDPSAHVDGSFPVNETPEIDNADSIEDDSYNGINDYGNGESKNDLDNNEEISSDDPSKENPNQSEINEPDNLSEGNEPVKQSEGTEPKNQPEGGESKNQPENTEPKTQSEGTEPEKLSEGTEPKTQPENTEPKTQSEGTEPKTQSEGTEPKNQPEGTEPEKHPEGGESKTQPENTEPKTQSEGTEPKTQPESSEPKNQSEGTEPKTQAEGNETENQPDGCESTDNTIKNREGDLWAGRGKIAKDAFDSADAPVEKDDDGNDYKPLSREEAKALSDKLKAQINETPKGERGNYRVPEPEKIKGISVSDSGDARIAENWKDGSDGAKPGTRHMETVKSEGPDGKPTIIDRVGGENGNYFSPMGPDGEPYSLKKRAIGDYLPHEKLQDNDSYHQYEVKQDFTRDNFEKAINDTYDDPQEREFMKKRLDRYYDDACHDTDTDNHDGEKYFDGAPEHADGVKTGEIDQMFLKDGDEYGKGTDGGGIQYITPFNAELLQEMGMIEEI